MNRFSANIHSINTSKEQCIVTIMDRESDTYILDNKNIGLVLNPDGEANTAWIKEKVEHIIKTRITPAIKKNKIPAML